MREYAETFCPIDHASIDVKNIAEYIRFFENVFGMKVWRVKGPAESPDSRRNYQEGKKKSTVLQTKYSAFLVENSGIEPLTSCMPCKRSPEPRGHTPHTRLWGRMMIYVKSSCYAFFSCSCT